MTVTALQKSATAARSDGKITLDEAKKLVPANASADEKAYLRDMLARDSFDPKARAYVQKVAGKPTAPVSKLAGKKLGTVHHPQGGKFDVLVSRELSPADGYKDKWQALGDARASGAKNTAVIQDAKGRWHAVETNVWAKQTAIYQGAKDKDIKEVMVPEQPLPEAERARLRTDASAALKAWQADKTSDTKRAAAEEAYKKLAAADFGVDPKEINVIQRTDQMDPKKLNFMLNIPHGEAYFGNAKGYSDPLPAGDRQLGQTRPPAGIVFGPHAFDSTSHAAGVLHHEATHKADHDLANERLAEWRKTGEGKKGGLPPKDFSSWLAKTHGTGMEYQVVTEQIATGGACSGGGACSSHGKMHTEVKASLNEWITTFAGRSPTEPRAFKSLEDINDTWSRLGSKEEKEIFARLDAFIPTLDEAHRAAFEAYLKKEPADSIFGRYRAQRS